MPPIFPFTAIVGQERMKRSLILNAIHSQIGGVLIRGERGTAKSTAARALAALLPEIAVVADCSFGCDPDQPVMWCTECQERTYTTTKNRRNDPARLELNKYCPRCRSHKPHREVK